MVKKSTPAELSQEVVPEFLGPEVLIEYVPIDTLKLWEQNPRLNDPAVPEVMKSIREYGFLVPVVVGKDMVVKAGNTRLKAARKLGLKRIPVVRAEHLTEEQLLRFALVDNRVAEIAKWDMKQISRLVPLEELRELPGFDKKDVDRISLFLLKENGPAPNQDDIPEIRTTSIKLGDLFLLGEHRLLCGDATVKAQVSRLMGSDKADVIFTDPPYGVEYDGGTKVQRKLAGDHSTGLYEPCCEMASTFSKANAALYLWHAGVKGIAAAAAAAAIKAGWQIRCEIIWNKNQAQFGTLSAQYKQKHEPAYYCFKVGETVNWCGPTNEVTVWDINRESKNELHPTQKPVELAERAILNHEAGIVLDIFGGSGSTLIACEKNFRKCRMMEIDPIYCQVIINRWEAFTGKKATKG